MYKHFILVTFLFPLLVFGQQTIVQGQFSTDNYQIVYETIGADVETIVIVHGLFADRGQWRDLSQDLSKEGYQVIIYDLPGYGDSTTNTLETYEIATQVAALEQLIQHLNVENIHIAGHSMGGLIAALYALQNPDHLSSLAFIGAPLGLMPVKLSATEELWQLNEYPFIPTTPEEFNRLLELLYTNIPDIDAETVAELLRSYRANYIERIAIVDIVKKYRYVLDNFSVAELPTLILWGDAEHVFDVANATNLQSRYENSELVIIENGSHMLHKENHDLVKEYFLSFLRNITLYH